jgi:OOP family OmpA-OmpF porin
LSPSKRGPADGCGRWSAYSRFCSSGSGSSTALPRLYHPSTSALGAFFSTKLPDGTELNIPQNGIENKVITFLNDSSRPVDTTTWFNFDRLLIDSNSATLQPSSQGQLNNIVAILKAYPNVHIKIGGYTDNTGDPAANQTLSQNRAKNVMDAIVAGGIDPSRLESKGYGDQYPVADNSTPEGRAQNRRIALLVTQK